MDEKPDIPRKEKKKIDVQKIINKINEGIDVAYENVEIIGDLDITVCDKLIEIVNDKDINIIIKNKISFKNCVFRGDLYFYQIKENIYYKCRFLSEAYFIGSQFLGNADFDKAQFSGETDFTSAQFSCEADFHEAKFSSKIIFTRAKFSGWVDFHEAKFSNEADFHEAKFLGGIDFTRAKFSDGADFSRTEFSSGVDFTRAEFSSETYFYFTKFSGGTDFIYIQKPSFNAKIIFQDTFVGNCSFLYSNIDCFDFQNVKWVDFKGRNAVFDEFNIKDEKDKDNKIKHIEILYRQLKCKFLNNMNYSLSDDFLYGEFRMKLQQKKGISKIISWERLYKLASDFGMSWIKPLGWVFLIMIIMEIYVIMACIWMPGIVIQNGSNDKNNQLLTPYFLYNVLFIQQKTVEINAAAFWGIFTLILARLENIVLATLFVLAGFAIRRKFRT